MFVNCLSEIDSALSQVNVLMSEVNSKLELCSAESRKLILSRLSNILSEMMWAVSLSADESSDTESNVSSYSADVESLAWDSSEDFYYKLYYEEEEDEDYMEERSLEIDDHGPIEISEDSSEDKEAVPEDNVAEEDSRKVVRIVRKIPASPGWIAPKLIPAFETDSENDIEEGKETVPPPKDTSAAKFVTEMSTKIGNLAPGGSYKVARPLKYKIELTNVNVRFLQNIPKPELYPIIGVSQDPKFYEKDGQNENFNYYNRRWYRESGTMRHPHGTMYGYSTDVGIVPVPDDPVHGHVWKDGQWTLQAQVDDGVPASRGSWSPPRRRGRPSG